MNMKCLLSALLALIVAVSLAAPASAAMITYKVHNGVNMIVIVGDIAAGDAERFAAIVPQDDLPTGVFLSSNGGTLIEGLEIGESIRARHYDTIVPSGEVCASVCG